jgi:3-oxoacyl-[acyl-carrier protein] reductase
MEKSNKYALVTGASRGIGKAIAISLAKAGYNIIIHYNNRQDAATETAHEVEKQGRLPYLIQADLTDDHAIENMFRSIEKFTDHIDCLINNAGGDIEKTIEEFDINEMRYVIELILVSKINITKHCLKLLKKSKNPCIVNISSRLGREKTIETIGAYGPAQAGVMKFTQVSALELAQYKIRVNCVAPGLTRTDLSRSFKSTDFEKAASLNPSGRVGEPEDIANIVKFLVSEESNYINGEIIGVNGGSNLV